MLLSKNLKSSDSRSELSCTINSASLLPGNDESTTDALEDKTTGQTVGSLADRWRRRSSKRCRASPLHGLHLHGGNPQNFSYFALSFSGKVTVAERLETGC